VAKVCETLEEELVNPDESPEIIEANVCALIEKRLGALKSMLGTESLAAVAGQVVLSTIDSMWTEHLNDLERVDEAVGLRGYAQLDPLLEFKKEAHDLYQTMLIDLRVHVLARLLASFSKE
jgi:preprotein translocase subunit SecA